MFKRFLPLFLCLLALSFAGASHTQAQTAAIQQHCFLGGTAAKTSGLSSSNYLNGIIPHCAVTVYLTGTQTLATIYSDASNAPLANPFLANTLSSVNPGGWIFWAAVNQGYDIVMSGGDAPNTYPQPVTLVDQFPGSSFSGTPTVVEVNGTPISPSSPANFVNTSSVTWAFTGGQIQATATGGGGGGCGPLAGDATSTDCGNDNLSTPPTSPAYLQAYGTNNLNTLGDGTTNVVASGNDIANSLGSGSSEVVGVGFDLFFNPANGTSTADNTIALGSAMFGNSQSSGATTTGSFDLTTTIGIGTEILSGETFDDTGANAFSWTSEDAILIGQHVAQTSLFYGGSLTGSLFDVFAAGDGALVIHAPSTLSPATLTVNWSEVTAVGPSGGMGNPLTSSTVSDGAWVGDGVGHNIVNGRDIAGLGDGGCSNLQTAVNFICLGVGAGSGYITGSGLSTTFHGAAGNNLFAAGLNAAAGQTGNDNEANGEYTLGGSYVFAGNSASATQTFSTSGGENIAHGDFALTALTAGEKNVAIGGYAGSDGFIQRTSVADAVVGNANQTGSRNTWVGYDSGPHVASQLDNTSALGYGATNDASNQIVLGNTSVTQFRVPAVKAASGTDCLQVDSTGNITNTGSACGSGGGGSGTVTTVSVASANGFAGTVANPTTTPAITLSTTATGPLKGNGTAISAAAYTDIVGLWASGSCTGYLKSDGTCSTPSGGISGSGTTGYFSLWTGTSSLGNGHLDDGATTASTITSTEPIAIAVSGGQGGTFDATEGTAATAAAGHDILYADSANHCLEYSANGGSFACLSTGGSSGVSSFTGDSVVLNNSASTGAVTATLATHSANTVFAGPSSGSAATPTFRALVPADLPAGTGTVTSIATTSPITGGTITTTGTIACATCVVASSPGAGYAHFAGSTQTVTSIGLPWSCQTGLGDGLNAIPAGTYLQTFCYNDTGQTVTLTGLKCYIDGGASSTMNATNGAGTGLLTGAVTCTTSFAAGTQSGTTTIASGDSIKFTFVADGTAKQTTFVVTGSHP